VNETIFGNLLRIASWTVHLFPPSKVMVNFFGYH